MPSATDFLRSYIRLFMNFERTRSPNFGSGRISRFSAWWRLDILRQPLVRFWQSRARPGISSIGFPDRIREPQSAEAYLGRFAPYFERRCLRFLTPWVSSTPR